MRNKIYIILSILVIGVMLVALHFLCMGRYPSIGTEDTYLSTTAYTLMEQKSFSNSYFHHVIGCQEKVFYPPATIFLIYFSYLLFGFGIWQTKLIALLSGVISAGIFFLLSRKIFKSLKTSLFSLFLFISQITVFRSWQSGRPRAPSRQAP